MSSSDLSDSAGTASGLPPSTPDAADATADAPGGPVRDEPVLEQNHATDAEKIAGIIEQTRVDLGDESVDRYVEVIRQRTSDSGIEVTDDELRGHAQNASGAR